MMWPLSRRSDVQFESGDYDYMFSDGPEDLDYEAEQKWWKLVCDDKIRAPGQFLGGMEAIFLRRPNDKLNETYVEKKKAEGWELYHCGNGRYHFRKPKTPLV